MRKDITRYPICQSIEDIERHSGSLVRLIGTYRFANASKGRPQCWVAEVTLQDNTIVVVGYDPASDEVQRLNNRKVSVIGRILPSYPDEHRQWIVAPHLMDIESIEEYTA